jgi:hypothetical protein
VTRLSNFKPFWARVWEVLLGKYNFQEVQEVSVILKYFSLKIFNNNWVILSVNHLRCCNKYYRQCLFSSNLSRNLTGKIDKYVGFFCSLKKLSRINNHSTMGENLPYLVTLNLTDQGCQMLWFQTKNPNLGKYWRALKWKRLVYYMAIWNILWPFGIYYGHSEYWNSNLCSVNLVYFPHFGTLYQEKSGNPVSDCWPHTFFRIWTRVARWFLFRPKIPIWVYFGGSWNRKCCYIFWSFGIFYDHWVYIMAFAHFIVIWYIFTSFGISYQEKSGNPDLNN